MANVIYIPFLNPINFTDLNKVELAQYHTKFLDDYQYFDTVKEWQEQKRYIQKWQNSDTITLQIEANFAPLEIRLVNQYGNYILVNPPSNTVTNSALAGVSAFEFKINLASVPEGCYYLLLTNGNLSEVNSVSEPLWIKAKHKDTVYIEYRNTRFHLDVLFETNILFGLRLEAGFDALRPGSNTVSYEDQKANPYILSARPFRTWPFVIGGSYGVPDWIVDKINMIFSCNDVRIDGKSFAKNGETALTFQTFEDYPLRGITIDLREGINRSSKVISPGIDPNKKILVTYEIETDFFGGLSNASGNVNIITAE